MCSHFVEYLRSFVLLFNYLDSCCVSIEQPPLYLRLRSYKLSFPKRTKSSSIPWKIFPWEIISLNPDRSPLLFGFPSNIKSIRIVDWGFWIYKENKKLANFLKFMKLCSMDWKSFDFKSFSRFIAFFGILTFEIANPNKSHIPNAFKADLLLLCKKRE